jgi:hypothetical protein
MRIEGGDEIQAVWFSAGKWQEELARLAQLGLASNGGKTKS